jgi:hypothetical protein
MLIEENRSWREIGRPIKRAVVIIVKILGYFFTVFRLNCAIDASREDRSDVDSLEP